jgi:hypothetical protein
LIRDTRRKLALGRLKAYILRLGIADIGVRTDWMFCMAASRSTETEVKPPQPPAPARSPARRAQTVNRKIADMLRDLQIDGKALSAEIERLRHRFL